MTKLSISPPLLNACCPWSTTLEHLQALYDSPYTGAITFRTSMIKGYPDDTSVHQYAFFAVGRAVSSAERNVVASSPETMNTTLNTIGFSPIPLSEYLGMINDIVKDEKTPSKLLIISVTGPAEEVAQGYAMIAEVAARSPHLRLAIEINLSCPNIANKPPPAYNLPMFIEHLDSIAKAKKAAASQLPATSVPVVGVKLPPYTYKDQFEMAFKALKHATSSVVDFVTCTNTLGTCLIYNDMGVPTLNSETGSGIGGLAGAAIHPLSLGNVAALYALLAADPTTQDILIIGCGGVEDKAGYNRMCKAGAGAVAVASAVGRLGVQVFELITNEK
ncbi:dihydroorotate dehydrogenase [Gregarina niphandrodes]|uniref:Dihydroorotate dehydrogenase n=1 Tax=Gregarina niphandrodes TaxID=110365 RepID=A0A023BC35_GRENI|nr:dihydroorotate dehydrogenase [Gregarina niphandrodes]EZG81820.1 dihydroorotate dehydrogenase [Gregarina niphandrodes]|eukprot:XP_011134187.1 dihydroorotate dehydrogenase [Gregarina niphandrodes]